MTFSKWQNIEEGSVSRLFFNILNSYKCNILHSNHATELIIEN